MMDFIEACFSGPILPASVLLVATSLYWMLIMVGAIGLELLDFDLDFDADFDADSALASIVGAGAATLKFLNIGMVPVNIWLSAFSLSWWILSVLMDKPDYHATLWLAAVISLRNAVLAIIAAKLLTQPLRGRFEPIEPTEAKDLIGSTGEVITSEVSRTSGQARFVSDAAPLLLNVRTVQGVLPKGEHVRIVEYDPETHVYLVERASKKANQEVSQ